jgi:hypothetical protein
MKTHTLHPLALPVVLSGVTFHIQHESPAPDKETYWLPAPKGSIWRAMRLYWPGEATLDGSWRQPTLVVAE